MKIHELKALLEDCDDNAEIPWTLQGEPYAGHFYIDLTDTYNAEIMAEENWEIDYGEESLLPPNTVYVGMDL